MKRLFTLFIGAFLLVSSPLRGQGQLDTLNTIFHTNSTPIWEYTFLRSTTKEYLENANRLELRLLTMMDRLQTVREQKLLLEQAIGLANTSVEIAGIGERYAEQALHITRMNADIAQLRVLQKGEQIGDGFATLEFMKKKHDEIASSGIWKWLATAAVAVTGAAISLVTAGAATPLAVALGKGAVIGLHATSAGAGVVGAVAGANDEKRDIEDRDAITERQTQDQLRQMKREREELIALAQLSQQQVISDEIAYAQAIANRFQATQERNNAIERLSQFQTDVALDEDELKPLIAEIERILHAYLRYAVVLAKLTEQAYQAEEVVSSNHIKSLDEYLNGSVWLAAERLLLDLNTIEFNRITQKQQRPNFTTYTLSLRGKDPIQLQELRRKGVMNFDITQFELDSRFPGTYARTIKNFNIEVVALAEPGGIRGQITKEGLSWKKVPIGIAGDYALDDWFQYVPSVYKSMVFDDDNETLIFPRARGISQTQGLLDVFEGKPLSGTYTLEVPKYSNSFDYSTIVDVIITIDFASYYDPILKALIETELCEMSANGDFISGRELQYSMHLYQPDDWYEFRNPSSSDLNYQTRRYFPIYVREGDIPNYHREPSINSLSIGFMTEDGYIPANFSVTNTSLASRLSLTDRYGVINPMNLDNLPDSVWWSSNNFSYPVLNNPPPYFSNDTILYLYDLDTNLIAKTPLNLPNTIGERFELWLIKLEASDNPDLTDVDGFFDERKLEEIVDVTLNLGYQYNSDFCDFSGRTYAWMQVDEDTTRIQGIDGEDHDIPYLYVVKGGEETKMTQEPLARFSWDTNLRDSTFFLNEFINKGVYDDLVPFYSFVGPKTYLEEVEIQFDLKWENPRLITPFNSNRKRRPSAVNLYCEPSWIKIRAIENPFTKQNSLQIEVIDSLATMWSDFPVKFLNGTGEYEIGENPFELKFRYLRIPDSRGLGKIDIFIKRYNENGESYFERVFVKGPIFRAWRQEFETLFSLRLHREDFPNEGDLPNFILQDIRFRDLSRF